jgi:hypothetical protein
MSTAILPTVQELTESLARARNLIFGLTAHESFTIEDYPIGGANRGKAKLWVEFKKGQGFRTCRATTSKVGRWCNPKKSTYHQAAIVVVSGPGVERDVAWLVASSRSIYLAAANWDATTLVDAPYHTKPRRVPQPYTMNGVAKELPADDPALCDLWDAWEPAYQEIQRYVLEKFKEVNAK